MPIYDYECEVCGFTLEVQQKVDDPPPICTHTQNRDSDEYFPAVCTVMKKIISKTAFSLKGPGWARDNYGSGKK